MKRLLLLLVAAALIPACGSDSGGGGVLSPPTSTTVTTGSLDVGSAALGSPITIMGTGFLDATDVQIGGISQTFVIVDDTTIIVDPVDAATPLGDQGLLVVDDSGLPSNSLPILITALPPDITVPPAGVPSGLVGFAAATGDGLSTTTGGEGGSSVTVTSSSQLASAVSGTAARIVNVSGAISGSGMMSVGSNKTISGLGTTATISGFGLRLTGSQNVIITNLTFRQANDDSIEITSGSHHIWVHHNEFFPAFDGSVDIKRGSSYVTVSWNHFQGTDKSMLLGHSDTNGGQDIGRLKVTYHHNWFDSSSQRHPRARFNEAHVFNNYYDSVGSYGIAATEGAVVVVQGNVFENTPRPTVGVIFSFASAPGHPYVTSPDTNLYINSGTPETRAAETSPTFFDPWDYYTYTLEDSSTVAATVTAGAGVQ